MLPESPVEAHDGLSCPLPGVGPFRNIPRAWLPHRFIAPGQENSDRGFVAAAYAIIVVWGVFLGLFAGWLIWA